MTVEDIIKYVIGTPHNSNSNVLRTMLETLEKDLGEELDIQWIIDYVEKTSYNTNPNVLRFVLGKKGHPDNTEAYAVFDDSDGSLVLFRDTKGKYSNEQVEGTKTYFTGIEETEYDLDGDIEILTPWIWLPVKSFAIRDTIKPKSLSGFFVCHGYRYSEIQGLENLDTSEVVNMSWAFHLCENISELDLSHFDTSKAQNMRGMFDKCWLLEDLDISSFDTSNVKNMESMFDQCTAITELDLSHFNTSKVITMYRMFNNCSMLANLNISNFNTSQIINMGSMFYGCEKLTELDLSHFDTSKVGYMNGTFGGCSTLQNLNINSFDTSAVKNFESMFSGCSNLGSLDVSHFNTEKAIKMNDMFKNCSKLTSIDTSGFTTTKALSTTSSMFEGCENLTELNVLNFDISNVIYMSAMFKECSKLTELDLSNFVRSSERIWADQMFMSCSSLKTIYATDDFNLIPKSNISNMFLGCTSIVGGKGTVYNPSPEPWKRYARIDNPPDEPGYFTDKNAPSEYPYTIATIGVFSPPGTYTPGDWVSIPNNLVSILEAPKNEIEYGGLTITNIVVNGVSYDEISCEVRLYDEDGVTVIEGSQLAEIPGYLSIYFNRQNLTVDSAGVLVDGEYISFSWESATIRINGGY